MKLPTVDKLLIIDKTLDILGSILCACFFYDYITIGRPISLAVGIFLALMILNPN